MRITWSPLAIRRVLEIRDFIALDKPEAAERWAESIFDSVERLEAHPRSGRVVPEVGREDLREVIRGGYRVVYRVREEEILVLTVRASRQSFDADEIG